MTEDFSYAETGATQRGERPAGYRHLHVRTRLGAGEGCFRTAARAVLEWRMHRAMGVTVDADAEQAAESVRVVVGLGVGWLRVHGPCRVVWAVEEERRAGFGYGTLPGHPEVGEEAFVVSAEEDGSVWLTVSSFSVPGVWWTRAAGPLITLFQRAYARRCGRVLRHLVQSG
ncbi:DUF1990 family protein [Streptomyces gobiensis]|uniref:DUF1990 family protein n=1 Tax=Streptomyces gobiensis TaxID=2875706 RepID=UPI001E6408FC|nr:DUF1990 domain-containing protein [Streptomyces gobiensis]UGY94852.1 DUF1990 domain-containing protein [Streptomyces gobiensis]